MTKLYMFDLDGVLIDSKTNMHKSWDTCKSKYNLSQPFEDYFSHVGKPFRVILNELGIMTNHEAIKKTYDDTSLKHVSEVTIYPGVVETLQRLKDDGNKIAVVTSKSADRTEVMIQGLPDFDFVVSPKQGLRGKPNPDQLLFCMAMCNVDPQDTYYIGDMQTDYDAAQRAGVEFIHVKYGYGKVKCKITLSRIEQLILP